MPEDRKVQQDALRLLHTMIAASESQDWQNADTFVALTTDDETKQISLSGPFSDPIAAMAWAEEHEAELNRGAPPDEIPFVVTVFPMIRPS